MTGEHEDRRLGARDGRDGGPPWIFGLRGAPQEAPENTLAGLLHAIGLGLDGVAYDVRACASGDLVLMADAYVDRTTDLCGLVCETSPLELSRADAGAHFGARFGGERTPYLSEALTISGGESTGSAQHVLFVHEPDTLGALAEQVREHGARLSVRVASDQLQTCRDARDLGLESLWIVARADGRVRELAREERLTAVGCTPEGWRASGRGEWSCERVCLRCDRPEDLLDACRVPFNAIVTSEPRRALAVRELVRRAPLELATYPLQASRLAVESATRLSSEGEWCGRWRPVVSIRNPFLSTARVEFELRVRRGAFEFDALPEPRELAPGQTFEFEFDLAGGSWSPGADPLVVARLECEGAVLELDAALERVRSATLHDGVLRLALLRESPSEPAASVTVRRHRGDLLAAIESPGDLEGARVVVRLGDEVTFGGDGVRVRLPVNFEHERAGAAFSIGILGARRTPRGRRRVLRRWAGGLPDVAPSGAPGRLLPGARV